MMIPPIYRPPSEAHSLLLQVTIGCSHNLCTYCDMYRSKNYSVNSWGTIQTQIEKAKKQIPQDYPLKVFLCDGDALAAPTSLLLETMSSIKAVFPNTRRFSTYATVQNILDKSADDLRELKQSGLELFYIGLESGNDDILKLIVKGNNSQDYRDAFQKIRPYSIKTSVMIMLGIGGTQKSNLHIRDTGPLLKDIKPNYLSYLSTFSPPGLPYQKLIDKGRISPLTTKELLREMKEILLPLRENRLIFRSNHISNNYPIGGTFPTDFLTIIKQLDKWHELCPEGQYPPPPLNM